MNAPSSAWLPAAVLYSCNCACSHCASAAEPCSIATIVSSAASSASCMRTHAASTYMRCDRIFCRISAPSSLPGKSGSVSMDVGWYGASTARESVSACEMNAAEHSTCSIPTVRTTSYRLCWVSLIFAGSFTLLPMPAQKVLWNVESMPALHQSSAAGANCHWRCCKYKITASRTTVDLQSECSARKQLA